MNISQLARNQRMMYQFINRNAGSEYQSLAQSQLSSLSSLATSSKADGTSAESLLQSMGLSGLQGRTIREMAQYKMREQANQANQASSATQQTGAGFDISSALQQFSVRQRYTPISDEATEAMQSLALQDAINSAGNASSSDSKERVSLIQEQLKSVEPSKRAAAFNTMNKVWESELDRIGQYIKEKDPSWNNWGDQFDTAILNDYKAGVNIWV